MHYILKNVFLSISRNTPKGNVLPFTAFAHNAEQHPTVSIREQKDIRSCAYNGRSQRGSTPTHQIPGHFQDDPLQGRVCETKRCIRSSVLNPTLKADMTPRCIFLPFRVGRHRAMLTDRTSLRGQSEQTLYEACDIH